MTDATPRLSDAALHQLYECGPTWDGDLVCKSGRDELVKSGIVGRKLGFNFIIDFEAAQRILAQQPTGGPAS